mmetsp:Transcript_39243/g.122818  ORF Transcript_39243/g.122818 Transcript_39243/m.122818 type:complete len:241 (-) Transcript_39243:525-1247(-)
MSIAPVYTMRRSLGNQGRQRCSKCAFRLINASPVSVQSGPARAPGDYANSSRYCCLLTSPAPVRQGHVLLAYTPSRHDPYRVSCPEWVAVFFCFLLLLLVSGLASGFFHGHNSLAHQRSDRDNSSARRSSSSSSSAPNRPKPMLCWYPAMPVDLPVSCMLACSAMVIMASSSPSTWLARMAFCMSMSMPAGALSDDSWREASRAARSISSSLLPPWPCASRALASMAALTSASSSVYPAA